MASLVWGVLPTFSDENRFKAFSKNTEASLALINLGEAFVTFAKAPKSLSSLRAIVMSAAIVRTHDYPLSELEPIQKEVTLVLRFLAGQKATKEVITAESLLRPLIVAVAFGKKYKRLRGKDLPPFQGTKAAIAFAAAHFTSDACVMEKSIKGSLSVVTPLVLNSDVLVKDVSPRIRPDEIDQEGVLFNFFPRECFGQVIGFTRNKLFLERAGETDCSVPSQIPFPHYKHVVKQMVAILKKLHEKDVAYLDVKPENFVRDDTFDLKLVDAGSAVMRGDRRRWIGTEGYAPKEALRDRSISDKTDTWALGATCFAMLTGKLIKLSSHTSERQLHVDVLREVDSVLEVSEADEITSFILSLLRFAPKDRPKITNLSLD